MRTGGSRRMVRAIASRCFSPPEKRWPRSPTTVSVALGQGGYVVVDLGRLGRRVQLLVGGVRLGEAQVVGDRGVEEVRLLGDDADRTREGVEVEVAYVDAVQRDTAAGDVVQTGHQVAERGLAGAGRADDGERCRRPAR